MLTVHPVERELMEARYCKTTSLHAPVPAQMTDTKYDAYDTTPWIECDFSYTKFLNDR